MASQNAEKAIVTIKVPKELKAKLEKAAAADNRNLTSLMLKISTDYLDSLKNAPKK